MKQLTVRSLVYCALFAALIAVFAQLQVPVGPVPISLATLGVMLCGLLLGWKLGAVSVAVYILLGLAGAPVFAGLKGGAAALTGATGGYIIGYLPYVILAGLAASKWQDALWGRCALLVLGTLACYALGTAWFIHVTGRTLAASMSLCVLPFLPGDAAKIILSALLAPRLRKALKAQG